MLVRSVRAFATNDAGTVYGLQVSFTTLESVVPVLSGSWNDPLVWGGVVPGPGDNVVIGSGITITIPAGKASAECMDLILEPLSNLNVDGSLTVNGNLKIESDATGSGSLIDKGTLNISGTRTVELYIPLSDRFYYIAMPLTGIVASVFGDISGTEKLYSRNASASSWNRITNVTDVLMPGIGYAVQLTGAPRTISLTGTDIITGNFNPTLLYEGDRWNLIGNPYPSPVDWGTESDPTGWVFNNVRNMVYVKHGGTFAIWNGAEDGEALNGGSRYIPAMQSFWVKTLGLAPAAGMNNLIRVHNGNLLMKSDVDFCQKLRIKVGRESYSDEAMLKFHRNSETSIDKLDAEKMFATDVAYPQISMTVENEKQAIASYPLFSGVFHQPLTFKTNVTGTFTFTFTGLESFGAATEIYLEDKVANKMVNLNENAMYTFESGVCDTESRFVIHIADGSTHFNPFDYPGTTGIDGLNVNVKAFGFKNSLNISAEKAIHATVKVYSILGAEITSLEMDSEFISIPMEVQGQYLVKIIRDKNERIFKISID